jgi:LysM repeat protein
LSAADVDKIGTNKYIVTKGDSLSSIARKNNTTSTTLKKLNKFSGENLKPGQIIIVK